MTTTNIAGLKDHLPEYINQAVEFNDIINISTDNGSAVIISEAAYNSLVETLYLSSNPQIRHDILEGKNTPIEECIPENEVEW